MASLPISNLEPNKTNNNNNTITHFRKNKIKIVIECLIVALQSYNQIKTIAKDDIVMCVVKTYTKCQICILKYKIY